MRLLIDLGNTRLKWATAAGTRLTAGAALDLSRDGLDAALERAWRELARPREVIIAATAPDALVETVRAVAQACFPGVADRVVATPVEGGGVRVAYAEPERLGVDRFLAMVAVRARIAEPAVVVSCGTAVAVDALDTSGRHLGGLIAPSPELMREAVLARARRVAWRRAGRILALGADTEDGLESGCWHAAAGLVRHALAEVERRTGAAPRLFVHGGAGATLAALLDAADAQVDDLVLDGLARWVDAGAPGG